MANFPDIRIGNDIPIEWSFYYPGTAHTPFNMEGRDLIINLSRAGRNIAVTPTLVYGNTIHLTYWGKDQNSGPGVYTITICENRGREGMHTLDKLEIFRLVSFQDKVINGPSSVSSEVSTLTVAPLIIESVTEGDYVKFSDIVDNLTSNDPTKVLSARQGKELAGRITTCTSELSAEIAHKADSASVYNKAYINTQLATKIGDTPNDGKKYVRKNGYWVEQQVVDSYSKTETDILLDSKQDSIYDLSSIRQGAEKGTEAITKIGNLSDLTTTNKTNLVAAINEAAQSGGGGTVDAYTKTETDALLNAKANVSTTYTKSEVDSALSGKANAGASYTKGEEEGLLAEKQDVISDLATIRSNAQMAVSALHHDDETANILGVWSFDGTLAVQTPTEDYEAANKGYVDTALSGKAEKFLVTATRNGGTRTCDKSFAEIKTAYDAGKIVILNFYESSVGFVAELHMSQYVPNDRFRFSSLRFNNVGWFFEVKADGTTAYSEIGYASTTDVGSKSNLTTTNKTNLVAAINEVNAGKAEKVTEVTTNPSTGLLPNVFYNLGILGSDISFSLADGTPADEYMIQFSTGSTAPTVTWPEGVSWLGNATPTIKASKTYQVSIVNHLAVIGEFENEEPA